MKSLCKALMPVLLIVLLLSAPTQSRAELDPVRRTYLEFGFADPLRGNGPFGGYGLLLFNRPHIFSDDTYLLTVVSPYLFTELVRDRWPSSGQAVGLGIGGGFLNNSFDQVRNGSFQRNESFQGHGADAALSYYLRPPPIRGILPIEGMLRGSTRYALYRRSGDTDPSYRLPEDSLMYGGRVGVRVGGVPPELLPEKALEFSVWHQADYRVSADQHGLPGRTSSTEHLTRQTWGRLGGIYPVRKGHVASVMLSAGDADPVDELSCFRLGSGLRFQDEFPYILHGYYFREVFARSFFLLNTSYRLPLWPGIDAAKISLNYDYAGLSYLSGHQLPRSSLNGLGLDLILLLGKKGTMTVGYGYGVDAPRHGGFGGHELNIMFEWKL